MNEETEQVLNYIEGLLYGEKNSNISTDSKISDDPELIKRLDKIKHHITDKVINYEWAEQKIDELNQILLNYALHDYNQDIKEVENDLFNSLAVSIQYLGEELNYSTVTKNYLKDIFDSIDDMLIAIDFNGNIVSGNSALFNTLSYEENHLIGQNIAVLLKNKSILPEILKKEINKTETEFLDKTDSPIPVTIGISSFVRGDNNAIGYIIIARDISKYSKLKDKIRELDFQLISYIDKLEKANEELKASIEKAKESEALKSAFLANMSHEIRTPLNAILGFSELLVVEEDLTERNKLNYFKIIDNNSNALLRLIEDIIDFSKIEANQIVINSETFDLNEVLTHLNFYYKNVVLQKEKPIDIILKKAIKNKPFYVSSDLNRIKQILTNLIDNAIKFTNQGSIEFGYHIIEDRTFQLYVKDTGIGIPFDKKQIIFDRFTKIAENKDTLYRGAGLGLAITERLVNLLKGQILVSSDVGKGTTFTVSIPIISQEQENHQYTMLKEGTNHI